MTVENRLSCALPSIHANVEALNCIILCFNCFRQLRNMLITGTLLFPSQIKIGSYMALGHKGAEYDAWLIDIGRGEQFGSGFVELNPNSNIPVLLDRTVDPARPVFESLAILHYLARKFGELLPNDDSAYTDCLSWLYWQESSTSFLGGGFAHFYKYAPYPMEYSIDRYAMESKRQLDMLDRHLADRDYIRDSEHCIADIAIWAWYGQLVLGNVYRATEFLSTGSYEHVNRSAQQIKKHEAVRRGGVLNVYPDLSTGS